jgi:hypothetical protein
MTRIQYWRQALIHYTARLDDGTILDSSFGGKTLEFTFGRCEVIPHFEEALREMNPGDTRGVRISSEELFICALHFLALHGEEGPFGMNGEMEIGGPFGSGSSKDPC